MDWVAPVNPCDEKALAVFERFMDDDNTELLKQALAEILKTDPRCQVALFYTFFILLQERKYEEAKQHFLRHTYTEEIAVSYLQEIHGQLFWGPNPPDPEYFFQGYDAFSMTIPDTQQEVIHLAYRIIDDLEKVNPASCYQHRDMGDETTVSTLSL